MTALVWWFLQTGLAAALLAGIFLLAGRTLKHRPAFEHALWVVVLAKLVTPIVVEWPWSVTEVVDWVRPASTDRETKSDGHARTRGLAGSIDDTLVRLSDPGRAGDRDCTEDSAAAPFDTCFDTCFDSSFGRLSVFSSDAPVSPKAKAAASGKDRVSFWLTLVWLAGSVLALFVHLRRVAFHQRLVRAASPAPRELQDAIERVAGQLGTRPLPALVVSGVGSPYVSCIGRLRLVWPEGLTGDHFPSGARGMIAHELAHVRRRDHWIAWLELATGVIWWWNPCFWFVRRRLRETAEMACDAIALGIGEGRREYAETLLALSCGFQPSVPKPALGVGADSRSDFERRLTMILTERVSGKLSVPGVFVVASLAAVVLPGWSLAQEPSSSEDVPAKSNAPRADLSVSGFGEESVDTFDASIGELGSSFAVTGELASDTTEGGFGPFGVTLQEDAFDVLADAKPVENARPSGLSSGKSPLDESDDSDACLEKRIHEAQAAHVAVAEKWRAMKKRAKAEPGSISEVELLAQEVAVLRRQLEAELLINDYYRRQVDRAGLVAKDAKEKNAARPVAKGEFSNRLAGKGFSKPQKNKNSKNAPDEKGSDLAKSGYVSDTKRKARGDGLLEKSKPGVSDYVAKAALSAETREALAAQAQILKLDIEAAKVKYEVEREKRKAIESEVEHKKRLTGGEEGLESELSSLRQQQLAVDLAAIDVRRAEGALELFLIRHPELQASKSEKKTAK